MSASVSATSSGAEAPQREQDTYMTNDQTPSAPLPQPPRPEVAPAPSEAPRSPQEAVQAQQERSRITLTVARDLSSRGTSLNKRYIALVAALASYGIDGTEGSGLRGQLNEAFVELREGAQHIDNALRLVNGVTSTLEDL